MTDEKKENELEILHPDQEIELAGEKITVREFRFGESLKLTPKVQPMIAAMSDSLTDKDAASETLVVMAGDYSDLFLELIEVSTGKSREWIEALTDADGMTLLSAFWQVNRPFFMRRLLLHSTARMVAERSPSANSTPDSSPTDTAKPPSTDTPGDKCASSTRKLEKESEDNAPTASKTSPVPGAAKARKKP
jgi:Family of unknown function (DUF6631)